MSTDEHLLRHGPPVSGFGVPSGLSGIGDDLPMKTYPILLHDGFRVGVTTGGDGIPLVFLHGFSVSAGAYIEMLELLANNGFEVFALDAPDHGDSDSLPYGHTVRDMAEVVAEALGVLGVQGVVLVGHSMGGAIVAELAATYPEMVYTAILLDAAVGEAHHRDLIASRGVHFLFGGLRDVIGDAIKAGSLRRLSERLDLANRLRQSVSGPGIARAALALLHHDTGTALRAMGHHRVNTVIVHGSEDRIVSPLAAMDAALLSYARVKILGGRFHSWMISDPELALRVIREALDLTPNEEDVA